MIRISFKDRAIGPFFLQSIDKYPLGVYNVYKKEKGEAMETKEIICDCCSRTRERNADELKALKNRLSRIEGQIRGISGMIDSDAYCVDILTQVSAVQSAISSFASVLLSQHITGCVVEDIKKGDLESAGELSKIIEKLMR